MQNENAEEGSPSTGEEEKEKTEEDKVADNDNFDQVTFFDFHSQEVIDKLGPKPALLIQFYHFTMMLVLLILNTLKLGLLLDGQLFVIIGGALSYLMHGLTFSNLEVMIHSPRQLALFTVSFLGFTKFKGVKDSPSALQYTLLKNLPFYIGTGHTLELLIRRQLVCTLDDLLYLLMYTMTCHVDLQMPSEEESVPKLLNVLAATSKKMEKTAAEKEKELAIATAKSAQALKLPLSDNSSQAKKITKP